MPEPTLLPFRLDKAPHFIMIGASTSLKIGMSGSHVIELQKALQAENIKVSADGIYGEETVKAVRDYQAAAGLMIDGIVGMGTRSRLGIT